MRSVFYPVHLRRTGLIALVVGSWLTLFNQGDVLAHGRLDAGIGVKIALNYLTPFVVANLGLLSNKSGRRDKEGGAEQ